MQLFSVSCHIYYDLCSSFKYLSEYIGYKVLAHPPDKSNSLDTKISFDLTEQNLYKLIPFNKTIQYKIFKKKISFYFVFKFSMLIRINVPVINRWWNNSSVLFCKQTKRSHSGKF